MIKIRKAGRERQRNGREKYGESKKRNSERGDRGRDCVCVCVCVLK
jgi:hypothetical protein